MTRPGPRRRIEPLAPPPDRFSAVYREATARRYHRAAAALGVTGVFLAGIFGGLTLGGGPRSVTNTVLNAAGLLQSPSASTTASTDGTRHPASPIPSGAVTKGHHRKSTVTAPPEEISSPYLRGEVLNSAGSPVSGLYVYTGSTTAQGFVPNAVPARTNAKGWYEVACTGGPLLIAPWRINTDLGPHAGGAYAARFVDTPSCDKVEHHLVTRVEEGAVLQGDVHTETSCAGTSFPVWLWIDGNRTATVRLSGLVAGTRYRISAS